MTIAKEAKTPRYSGAYNRLFPVKVSTSSMMTIYVLHLLNKQKRYGKEIIDAIEDRFHGQWKPSHGLIYPILRELESEGLVTGKWLGESSKKTVRVYEITDKGREAYKSEKQRHKELFAQSYNVIETVMSDLYDDVPLLWEPIVQEQSTAYPHWPEAVAEGQEQLTH